MMQSFTQLINNQSFYNKILNFYSQSIKFGIRTFLLIFSGLVGINICVIAQVEIPREGFPYCEPFTGFGPFENTIINGKIRNNETGVTGDYMPTATGQSLQLTPNLLWHNGYVIVDIPFSSQFGVKTSFEYYTYGNTPFDNAADGIGFFMFDADEPVNIGWLGGSLGYAPFVNGDGTVDPDKQGIKGGYLGIGFDEWGNFAVGTVGQPFSNWETRVRNSVTIRAPESQKYDFYERFQTQFSTVSGVPYTPPFSSDLWFPIDHRGPTRVTNCAQPGYRKVFIELIPSGIGYQIQIDMLVNHSTFASPPQRISFPAVNYPFPAPPRLKIGFTGATGGFSNFHEIANVTVNVSDIANISEPQIVDINEFICVNDGDLGMEFKVQLATSDAFITCLQLFNSSPGFPDNSLPVTDYWACGLLCVNKCKPSNYSIPAYDQNGDLAGTFYSELQDLNTSNFNQLRDLVNVRFEPVPGFVGQASVFYNVTDNYGLTSEPGIITVTAHPFPVVNTAVTIVNPSCDGQEDGSLSGLTVSSLVPGYDYEWLFNGTSIGKSGATDTYDAGTQTAVFDLQGLNLGTYTLNVWNPKTNGGCYETHDVIISQEDGTPVILDAEDKIICEGEEVFFLPSVDNLYNPSGASPQFNWYLNANRSGGALVSGSTVTIEGNPVLVTIQGNGEITFSGLTYVGPAATKTYTFYVEARDQSTPSGNFCPFIGDVLASASVEVYPPLDFSVTHQDDWCLEGIGSITGSVIGVTGPVNYILEDQSGNTLATNSTGSFTGLSPGDYSVFASTSFCNTPVVDVTVEGPSDIFQVTEIDSIDPECSDPSGSITFSVSGGTPIGTGNLPFTLEVYDFSIPGNNSALANTIVINNDGTFTISGFDTEVYRITLFDANRCPTILNKTFSPAIFAEFAVNDIEVCLGELAVLEAIITIPGDPPAVPTFVWYSDPNGSPIQPGVDPNNASITYSFTDAQLLVDGLAPGDHIFYLKPEGPFVCFDPVVTATISITQPLDATVSSIPATCFGTSTGSISVALGAGLNLPDFEFLLEGISSNYQSSPNFNNIPFGTYNVIFREIGSSCPTTLVVDVDQPDLLQLTNPTFINPTCGEINGELSFSIAGGSPDYTIFINNQDISSFSPNVSGNTYTLNNLPPASYSIKVVDVNGCEAVQNDWIILDNDQGVTISIDPIDVEICENNSAVLKPIINSTANPTKRWFKDAGLNEEITSNPNPDNNGITYEINSGTGELTIQGLLEGTYNYYLQLSGPGLCTLVTTADLEVFAPISAQVETEDEGCFQAADGIIRVIDLNGGKGIYEFSIDNANWQDGNEIIGLVPGTYTIFVRDISLLNSCSLEIPGIVVEGPSGPIAINTPDLIRASCDLENGSIENLQISGGWGNYQVEWRRGSQSGPVIPGTVTGAIDLGPDTYYVSITDAVGCEEVFTFIIEESSDPVYDLVNPLNSCFGELISIRPIHLAPDTSLPPTAFTEVMWYKEPGQVGLIENGPDPQNPSIIYTIDDSDWLNPQLLIENLPAGSHEFYFFVQCTGQEIEVELIVYETPQVVFEVVPVTCFGDTNGKILIESGALPEYRFSLNGAAPIDRVSLEALNLNAGTYVLEITAPAGCPQTETIEIESPLAPLAISGITQIDPGCGASNGRLEAEVSGGRQPYSITLIRNGAILNSFTSTDGLLSVTGLTTGVYKFEVSDAGGCQIESAAVDLVDGPTQILIDDLEICSGENAIFTPVLDPIDAGASYNWTFDAAGANSIVSGSTIAGVTYQIAADGVLTVSGLSSSNSVYRYFLTASGGGVCTGFVATAEVRVFDSPQATFIVDNEVCFGDGGQIQINATGGSETYTYSLNGQPAQNSNIFQVPVGTYSVRINTPQGCFVELTNIDVTGPSGPLNISGFNQENPTCELENGTVSFAISGGYGDYNVEVTKNGVFNQMVQADGNGIVRIPGIGSGSYEFEVSDAEGCLINLGEPLELVEVPTVISVNDQRICVGESAQLLPTVPSNIQSPVFNWYFDANESRPIQSGSSSGITYAISSAGQLTILGLTAQEAPYTYYVMASGIGICGIEPREVNVYVSQIPTLRVSNPSVVCDPEGTVDITNFIEGFNPVIYDYNVVSPNGSELRLDQLGTVNITGDYRVSSSMKDVNCWNQPQRIRVIISDSLLVADFQYTAELGGGIVAVNDRVQLLEPVQFEDLSIGGVILWSWDFGDGARSSIQNPQHTYTEKGNFTVILTTIDQFGCQSEYVMQLEVTDEYKVIVPNAFTPNGVKNQYFKPEHRGIADLQFYVFNTWGELIYHSGDLQDQGWDGTLNGQNVPNGNYVYKVTYQTRSGGIFELSGVFILIR